MGIGVAAHGNDRHAGHRLDLAGKVGLESRRILDGRAGIGRIGVDFRIAVGAERDMDQIGAGRHQVRNDGQHVVDGVPSLDALFA